MDKIKKCDEKSNNVKMGKMKKCAKLSSIPDGKHTFQIVGINYQGYPKIKFTLECIDLPDSPKINLFVHCIKKNNEINTWVMEKLITLYEDLMGVDIVDDFYCDALDDLLDKFLKGKVITKEYNGEMYREVKLSSLEAVDINLLVDDTVKEGVEEDNPVTKSNELSNKNKSENVT